MATDAEIRLQLAVAEVQSRLISYFEYVVNVRPGIGPRNAALCMEELAEAVQEAMETGLPAHLIAHTIAHTTQED